MFIRQIEPRDHEKLKLLAGELEIPDFSSQNYVTGLVVVDEKDEPRVMLCFRRTAEAYVVVDHAFDSPGYRLLALGELFKEAKPLMVRLGYEDVYGTIGPTIPKRYVQRLRKLGCSVIDWTFLKMWKEG